MFAATLASAPHVQAATRTWDNGGGDGLWSNATNWSLNTLPVAGDTVVFDATSTAAATINVPVNVAIIQMNAGYTGTITQNAGQPVAFTTSYTQAAGIFTAGASTVTVTGLTTVNLGGTFNGGAATLNLNGGLTVAGAFNANTSTTNVTGTTTVSAGGTFAGNAATINLTGALTANAGTFTSTTGTLTVTGAVTLAAGVFIHNGGTVVLSTSNVNVALAGGGTTFNNVQFLSGTKTISAGTMTVVGTLTLTGGALNTGTVAAQGAISVASTFTGGTGTLLINGTVPQTWTGGGATSDLPLVNINNPTSTLTMTGIFRTTRNWTFTASGGLTASASSIIFAGTQTITGTHTLGAVEIAGVTVTIATGTTLTSGGNLTLTSGILNQAGATGTLAAKGDISIATAYTGGTATLLINGTVPQTWSGSANSVAAPVDTLNVVNINDPTSTLTITASLRTTRNWTFTASGGLTASASSIIFAGGTITGTHTLGAVEIAGAVTIAPAATVSAGGNLTLTSGTLTTGTLAAQGNITIATAFTGGTTTLLINGTTPQTWSGSANGAADTLTLVNINDPTSTLTITASLRTTRNWTFTASGGLTASASSIIFAGGTITGTHSLGAVEIAGAVTMAAGTTLTVPGTLTLTSGSLNQAGPTGILAAHGDITATAGYVGGGSATLLINGSTPQTLNGLQNSAAGSLPNVEMANAGGGLTVSGTLRTARNWTYTSGGLTTAGSTLIFNGTQTLTGSHSLDLVEIRGGTITIAAGTTVTAKGNLLLFSGALNQAGATGTLAAEANIDAQSGFTGGTATLLINGSVGQLLTQTVGLTSSLPVVNIAKTGGALTMSGTFRTTRSWTYTSGGLTTLGSSIQFAGTLTLTGTHTLNAVEIAGAVTITAGTTVTAAGNLTLTSGSLNQSAATGTLAAQADITATAGFTGSGTATLLINGSVPQTLNGLQSSVAGSLPNVEIANAGGGLTISGILRTARNWTYTSGGLTTLGSTLIFNGTQTITGTHSLDTVEVRGGALTIAAGTTVTVTGPLNLVSGSLSGTGTMAAQSNIDAQVTFTGGGTATLLINGTGPQTLNGLHTALAGSMPNVVINKTSGALTITGTLRTARNWTYTNGGLITTGSTVIFNGPLTISGTHSLFNVYLGGGAHTVTAGDTLTALGTLTLDNGTIDVGSIAGAGPITQLSTFDGGTGLLAITGSSSHTFTGSATTAAGNLPDLQINTSGGTLTLAGTIRTAHDWTYLAGAVDPDGSTVVFAGPLTIDAGPMAFNHVLVNAGTATLLDDLTVNGDLTVAAGTLAIGSHNVFAAGDVTVNAGLTVTTGTLDMDGLTGQTLGGTAVIGLYNLTINDPVGVIQATTVAVAGTLDLGGPLDFSGETLSIAHAITGAPNNLAADATSTLIIYGAGAGIVIPSSLTDLLNLTITNPNGAALAGPLTVVGTFTLGGGNLDAGTFVLSIGPAGSVSRTSGHVVGQLQKWVPLGAGVTVQFEIGDATAYAPISVTFGTVSVTGQLTAFTTPGEHPNIATSTIDPAQDVNRWWSMTNAGIAFSTLDATFTWVPADVDPGANPGQFGVGKWDGSWTMPASGANTATTITAFGIASLGEFAVGEATPSPSGSVPDTSVFTPGGAIAPLILLVGFAAWIMLVSGLAMESTRQGSRRWRIPRR